MMTGIIGIVAMACLFMAFVWFRPGCSGDCGACAGTCEMDDGWSEVARSAGSETAGESPPPDGW